MIPLLLALASSTAAEPKVKPTPPAPQQLMEAVPPATASAAEPSLAAMRVADWISASADNHGLPYVIVDKVSASLIVYDGMGNRLGKAPVLIGVAVGDDATPGIGSKNLSEIGPAEKTTPAGRFLAKYGLAAGGQRVLWVDYGTSVALHPIPTPGKKSEHRRERMLSPTADDNRITFGCINVPNALYAKSVKPLFGRKGGYVYILPDTKLLETVFPRLMVQAVLSGRQ